MDTAPNRQEVRERVTIWPALGLCGLVLVLWLTVDGILAPSAALAAVVGSSLCVAVVRFLPPGRRRQTFAAVALATGIAVPVAAVTTPLSGVPLPDIGLFGPYTYLVTELLFGAVTVALLVRAGRDASYRTARTLAVIYPVAYLWDWYTLTVGVFAIPLRTGVELVGIPLEEHLFMLVVPGFVVAVHETLASADRGATSGEN
jgi:lycopene cyclase domain-containing protein